MSIRPLRLFPALVAAVLWLPAIAQAQYFTCGGDAPGQRVVGMTQAGNGVASVPLCEAVPEEPAYDGGGYAPSAPPYDPLQAQVDAQIGWIFLALDAAKQEAEARAKLESDPNYQAYKKGKWEFSKSGDAQHRRCTAFFATLDGAIAIGGQKGDKEGTFLTFMGPGVPAPNGMKKVKVTLEQTDSAPQTVKAFNHRIEGGMGAITFTVPLDIAAASDLFLDRQAFRVILKGKPVFDMGWHSGKSAQKKMRQCAG
ncbi:hypothetical protein OU426_02950 [Frigidibacter sp. RF13]|uniref:hypothetical protein n=1 Tax=Frigidibacter sp. RF13 TaxID=2997340 RepID=UPI00227205AA|nr:hypothetical protein [Frigidibacter sp. RF13]MCY1125801.1 hypothetical protein [Frigidibacter sp. RF13]